MKRSDATAYTRTSIFLHWIVAVLIFSAFPLGVYMHGMPLTPDKLRYFSYHKWMGVTVFLLNPLGGLSAPSMRSRRSLRP